MKNWKDDVVASLASNISAVLNMQTLKATPEAIHQEIMLISRTAVGHVEHYVLHQGIKEGLEKTLAIRPTMIPECIIGKYNTTQGAFDRGFNAALTHWTNWIHQELTNLLINNINPSKS